MSSFHLNPQQISAHATGAGGSGADHLRGCELCRARVDEERRLLERLAAAPRHAEPQRDLWPEIRSRLDPTAGGAAWPMPRRRRAALAAAAALVLFVGGFAAGRGTAVLSPLPGSPGRTAPAAGAAASPAATEPAPADEVQRAGTAYVAALSELRRRAHEGTPEPESLRQGGEVAAATLYGAAVELARLQPDDPNLARLLDNAAALRVEGVGPARNPAPPRPPDVQATP